VMIIYENSGLLDSSESLRALLLLNKVSPSLFIQYVETSAEIQLIRVQQIPIEELVSVLNAHRDNLKITSLSETFTLVPKSMIENETKAVFMDFSFTTTPETELVESSSFDNKIEI